jgi:hypothetical protein
LQLVEFFGYLEVIDVANVSTPNPDLAFIALDRLLCANGKLFPTGMH